MNKPPCVCPHIRFFLFSFPNNSFCFIWNFRIWSSLNCFHCQIWKQIQMRCSICCLEFAVDMYVYSEQSRQQNFQCCWIIVRSILFCFIITFEYLWIGFLCKLCTNPMIIESNLFVLRCLHIHYKVILLFFLDHFVKWFLKFAPPPTLYGGLVNVMSADLFSNNCSTWFAFVQLQHIKRCFHNWITSHVSMIFASCFTAGMSSFSSSFSGSSSTVNSGNNSSMEISSSPMLKFSNSFNSIFKLSTFRSDSFNLLSNMRNFLICSSVKSSTLTHGQSFNQSFWLASNLPCPTIITLFWSITNGWRNQNSRIEFAMRFTCVSSWILLLNS